MPRVLGPDAAPGTPEFDLFVREVAIEMSVKAGQKCTAIRRGLVPAAASRRGRGRASRAAGRDQGRRPARRGHAHGRSGQRRPVQGRAREDRRAGSRRCAHRRRRPQRGLAGQGRRFPLARSCCAATIPGRRRRSTTSRRSGRCRRSCRTRISPTRSRWPIAARAASRFPSSPTRPDAARDFVLGAAAFHGRMLVIDRDNHKDSTGHGSPLPVLVHGGPGRAGGSEEMGGVRGVKHYMQRTAIQSSPSMIAAITGHFIPGGPKRVIDVHPFRLKMSELNIGDTLEDRQPQRHGRGHRAFRRVHRRQILRPHGRGSGQGLADLRRPRRSRLSDPQLRRRPVRRSRSGPGPRQHRPRESPLPDAALPGRFDAGGAHRPLQVDQDRRIPARSAGRSRSSTRRTNWSRPTTS